MSKIVTTEGLNDIATKARRCVRALAGLDQHQTEMALSLVAMEVARNGGKIILPQEPTPEQEPG